MDKQLAFHWYKKAAIQGFRGVIRGFIVQAMEMENAILDYAITMATEFNKTMKRQSSITLAQLTKVTFMHW
jgi:TPR repeat protein